MGEKGRIVFAPFLFADRWMARVATHSRRYNGVIQARADDGTASWLDFGFVAFALVGFDVSAEARDDFIFLALVEFLLYFL